MTRQDLFSLLVKSFGFKPTAGQNTVLYHLAAFLLSNKQNPTYLLQGYAGTGKTTLVSTLVKTLPTIGMRYQLLAPTGRAAKVLSNYTGKSASTIHRKIYRFTATADGIASMSRSENKAKDTLFIVDECSMIGDESYNGRSLLDDLISFVFSGENCRLLLIGDKAQLPPVGTNISPANNIDYLKSEFGLTIASFEMTEVLRQALLSGILFNATELRDKINSTDDNFSHQHSGSILPIFTTKGFDDIKKINPEEFEELLSQSFGDDNRNDAVVICKSNKRANMYNQAIRARILQEEGEISTGDRLMVVKNNYFWTDETQRISFIANGDMIRIMRINHIEELYGFHFADVEIQMSDYQEEPQLSVKIILETLMSDAPALTEEESRKLYMAIEEDYSDILSKGERFRQIRSNPYYNALQVKFGYALTCHKTQGGQWNNIFIDAPYVPDGEEVQRSDLRWFYTAVTRAKERLFLVNFKDKYFKTKEDD
ncbi:MAG: ATP-dependent RecD-like DNA helicase [Candidatus Limimorpha sp.]